MASERVQSGIGVEHPRCPYCHEQVQPGGAEHKQSCADCMAWHHADCWAAHGGCAACNQARPATAVPARSHVAPGKDAELSRAGRPASERGSLVFKLLAVLLVVGLSLAASVDESHAPRGLGWHEAFLTAGTEEEKTRWCRLGAEAGDPAAMNLLGFRLSGGIGCKQDMVEAVMWGRRGAELGHGNAMFGLARMLEGGYGTPQDLKQAAHWYRRALAAGDPQAQHHLEDLLRRHPELGRD